MNGLASSRSINRLDDAKSFRQGRLWLVDDCTDSPSWLPTREAAKTLDKADQLPQGRLRRPQSHRATHNL